MGKIAMILRRSPYGDINAAEAVRHAMGGVTSELEVILIMVDGGVLLAREGQDESGTGFTNLGVALKDCIEMGVEVYADKLSLKEQHIDTEELIEGVKIANGAEIAEMVKEAKTTMIF
ncbi:MAG: DsrE family protein [Nitrospirae bacterium]|nr:DsrE family protein [Nitrospirota bacterium]